MKYAIIIAVLLLMSCAKQKISNHTLGQITEIKSLKNISLGQSDTVLVTFNGGTNGCAQAHKLESSINGNTIIIEAYYSYPVEPTICPQNIPVHVLKCIYKPKAKGTYTYQSFKGDVATTTVVK